MQQIDSIEEMILKKVIEVMEISEEEAAELTYDSAIFADTTEEGISIGIDSISVLALAVEIYETWGVDIPIEDMMKFDTVKSIAKYICEHSSADTTKLV